MVLPDTSPSSWWHGRTLWVGGGFLPCWGGWGWTKHFKTSSHKISCDSFKYLLKFIQSLAYVRGWCQEPSSTWHRGPHGTSGAVGSLLILPCYLWILLTPLSLLLTSINSNRDESRSLLTWDESDALLIHWTVPDSTSASWNSIRSLLGSGSQSHSLLNVNLRWLLLLQHHKEGRAVWDPYRRSDTKCLWKDSTFCFLPPSLLSEEKMEGFGIKTQKYFGFMSEHVRIWHRWALDTLLQSEVSCHTEQTQTCSASQQWR